MRTTSGTMHAQQTDANKLGYETLQRSNRDGMRPKTAVQSILDRTGFVSPVFITNPLCKYDQLCRCVECKEWLIWRAPL